MLRLLITALIVGLSSGMQVGMRGPSSASVCSVHELLSTCVDAARRGCDEIRAVQRRRTTAGKLDVSLKDAYDALAPALKRHFGTLAARAKLHYDLASLEDSLIGDIAHPVDLADEDDG